eukprot:6195990-Pleurochrysis_carterae.AAC.2
MMRMRGFTTDPEWRGKWSDGDAAWTSRLRQASAARARPEGVRARARAGVGVRERAWVWA